MCVFGRNTEVCVHVSSLVQDAGGLDVLALLPPGCDTLAFSGPPASQLAEAAEAAAR